MNIFDALENRFEPVFNNIKFKELEPAEAVRKLADLQLFKQVAITEASCDECQENCRGIKLESVDGKLVRVCPTGFLEAPRPVTPGEANGWQFDFNRLTELICAKSNLQAGWTDFNDFRSIAYDQIGNKTVAVTYYPGLSYENDIISAITDFSFRADVLFIITPSIDVVGRIRQLQNIYPLALKTVIESDFDVTGIIKSKLLAETPTAKMPYKFPTPPGTAWNKIKIIIGQDEEHCEISIGSEIHSYKYNNPKLNTVFVNKRDKKPNALWKLLVKLARGNSSIGWKRSGYAKRASLSGGSADALDATDYSGETATVQIKPGKNQKEINKFKTHIKSLRKTLQQIFPEVTDNPITYDKNSGVYQTVFEMSYRIDTPLR